MLDQHFFCGFKYNYTELADSGFPNVDPLLIPVLQELNVPQAIATIDSCVGHNDGATRHHALYIRFITQNMAAEIALWSLFCQLNDIINSLPDFNPGSVFKGQPTLTFKDRLISHNRLPEQARRVMTITLSMKFKKNQIELKQAFLDLLMEAIKTTRFGGSNALTQHPKKM